MFWMHALSLLAYSQDKMTVDHIISSIIEEAKSRKGDDLPAKVHAVNREVSLKMMGILDFFREEERREDAKRERRKEASKSGASPR